jgi:hypothetical protein
MFYAAAQTIAHGRRAGWLSAIGFHLGGFVHIAAAAFGMAILLKTVPALYVIVKLLVDRVRRMIPTLGRSPANTLGGMSHRGGNQASDPIH